MLLCINTQRLLKDENRMRYGSDQFYVRPPEEMYRLFPGQAEAVKRSQEIANKCDIKLDFKKVDRFKHSANFTPPFPALRGPNATSHSTIAMKKDIHPETHDTTITCTCQVAGSTSNPAERTAFVGILQLLETGTDLTLRTEMRGHATAGAILLDPGGRVLDLGEAQRIDRVREQGGTDHGRPCHEHALHGFGPSAGAGPLAVSSSVRSICIHHRG